MGEAQVEILVHASAPSSAKDDTRYRLQAVGYLGFEATRSFPIDSQTNTAENFNAGLESHGDATTATLEDTPMYEDKVHVVQRNSESFRGYTSFGTSFSSFSYMSKGEESYIRNDTVEISKEGWAESLEGSSFIEQSPSNHKSLVPQPRPAIFKSPLPVKSLDSPANTDSFDSKLLVIPETPVGKGDILYSSSQPLHSTGKMARKRARISYSAEPQQPPESMLKFNQSHLAPPAINCRVEEISKHSGSIATSPDTLVPNNANQTYRQSVLQETELVSSRLDKNDENKERHRFGLSRRRYTATMILPPQPSPTHEALKTFITPYLLQYAVDPNWRLSKSLPEYFDNDADKIHKPVWQERGHWRLETSKWTSDERDYFWQRLGNAISDGSCGWGVNASRGLESEPGEIVLHGIGDGGTLERVSSIVKVRCWGEITLHIFAIIKSFAPAQWRIEDASWYDMQGKFGVVTPNWDWLFDPSHN